MSVFLQDKLCGAYIKQSRGQAMQQRWTRENDRSLLIGYLKHGAGRFQAMIQDDTLGLRPALEVALENGARLISCESVRFTKLSVTAQFRPVVLISLSRPVALISLSRPVALISLSRPVALISLSRPVVLT